MGFALSLLLGAFVSLVSDPVLGASVAFVDAAWDSVSTGRWLRKADPHKSRVTACGVFYFATGCWKGAAASLITIILFAVVTSGEHLPNVHEIAPTLVALLVGVVTSTLLGYRAIYAAMRHRVRVWVHPRLRDKVDGDLRHAGQLTTREAGFNHAIFVVATTMFFPVVAIVTGLLIAVTATPEKNQDLTIGYVLVGLMFGAPVALIPVYVWLSSRIIARTPQECWADLDPQAEGHLE